VLAVNRIPVVIDAEIFELLGDSPEQIERAALEIIVLELYRRHVISGGRAAEILNLDLLTFIRWSGSRGVPYFDMVDEQWEHEVQSINKA
jgi:predicted HTH domain antitoxin